MSESINGEESLNWNADSLVFVRSQILSSTIMDPSRSPPRFAPLVHRVPVPNIGGSVPTPTTGHQQTGQDSSYVHLDHGSIIPSAPTENVLNNNLPAADIPSSMCAEQSQQNKIEQTLSEMVGALGALNNKLHSMERTQHAQQLQLQRMQQDMVSPRI